MYLNILLIIYKLGNKGNNHKGIMIPIKVHIKKKQCRRVWWMDWGDAFKYKIGQTKVQIISYNLKIYDIINMTFKCNSRGKKEFILKCALTRWNVDKWG